MCRNGNRLGHVLVVVLLVLLALPLWAGGKQEEKAAAAPARVIKVGYTAPFTGSAAEFGANGWRGVQLALEGGRGGQHPHHPAAGVLGGGLDGRLHAHKRDRWEGVPEVFERSRRSGIARHHNHLRLARQQKPRNGFGKLPDLG